MSDIFREVDEEVRHDRAKGLWKKYGVYVIGLAVLIVISVGGFKTWQYYSLQQIEKAGDEYLQSVALIDSGKDTRALEAFKKLGQKGSSGFYLLARFQEAGLLAKTGKSDEAIAIYDALADNPELEDNLRDLARLRAGFLLSNTATLKDVKARIGSLTEPGNPWRNTAREILAVTAFRTGDLVEADRIFSELSSDPSTSNAMRARATAIISIITPQLPAKPPKKKETKPDAQ